MLPDHWGLLLSLPSEPIVFYDAWPLSGLRTEFLRMPLRLLGSQNEDSAKISGLATWPPLVLVITVIRRI